MVNHFTLLHRFRFCAEEHFVHYGPTDNILREKSYSQRTTNVSGNSPIFDLKGNPQFILVEKLYSGKHMPLMV